eukprot:CAMPEP_0172358186 /NCGR_PEP_ID=MMETSP1060-20121228/2522_1 /TAXON_ID=37318 /ORGANISM="Pseudo-nitzschia pungens, Strain cf. cingulata" /LENGTH=196 /DNA_ID=CAMNT_0013079277 /DNA_START=75 /DNA_END=665 /DNA_ORIENTATION=+
MPSFSSGNTLQAADFKKRGVAKLIARNLGNSSPATAAFAEKTKKKIEKQSMMFKRTKPVRKATDEDRNARDVPRAKPVRKAEDRNGRDVPRGLKTTPSMAEDESREGAQDYILSDLSGYDDDSSVASIDWTLPGVDQNVDIRYEYIDTDYYGPDLREKRKEKVQKEGLQRMRSTDTMELIAKGSSFLCYGDWPKCI